MKFSRLLDDYQQKRQAREAASVAEIETRKAEYEAAQVLRAALEADAADQIGTIIETPHGEARIERVSTHAGYADIVHPVVNYRTKAGDWGKSVTPVYTIGFDHETRTWRAGKRTYFERPHYAVGCKWEWQA